MSRTTTCLLAQQWLLAMTAHAPTAPASKVPHSGVDLDVARQTSQAFEVGNGGAKE
jgi:hypothetical protein